MSTIVITGASSGLGADMARQFAAAGHDLALCARRTQRLDELAEVLTAAHPMQRFVTRVMDVTDDEQVFAGFVALRSELGHIDRVIVNAGRAGGVPLGTGGHEHNRRTVETNVLGALAQSDAALQIFRAQGAGHLVLVASMAALRGLPGAMATYSATKAALVQLAEGLRVELHGTPIKITVLYPGYVATEMNPGARPGLLMSTSTSAARAMVSAIEAERRSAFIPRLPWAPLSLVLRFAPTALLRRMLASQVE